MDTADDTPVLEVSTPIGQLPDLTDMGIEEYDNGICEDTPENRQILRQNKLLFKAVFNTDGTATPYIQAFTPDAQDVHNVSAKSVLLTDVRNKNAEYVTGYDLILDDDALKVAPAWVISATRKWLDVERKREETGKHVMPYLMEPPGRCVALKQNGTRCFNWHNGTASSDMRCKMHIGRNTEIVTNYRHKARQRIDSLSVLAVDELEKLVLTATSEPVRAKAVEMILDRVGIRAGMEIDSNVQVQVKPAAELLNERLSRLAITAKEKEDIIEAEVVEEKHDIG